MPSFGRKFMESVASVLGEAKLADSEKKELTRRIRQAKENEPPPTLVIIGESGVGKSTTINSLFNAGREVSAVRAATLGASDFYVDVRADDLTLSTSKGLLRVFDMPGLGDEMRTYDAYRDIYLNILPQADVVLWVHPAEDRTVAGVQKAVHELFAQEMPQIAERLVFGLNKADVIQPNDWNPHANVPSARQLEHLAEREADFAAKIRQVLPQWTGRVQAYSADRRYSLTSLFKNLMHAVPPERRWVLEERMDLADFFELVDRRMLQNAQKVARNQHTPPSPAVDPAHRLQGLPEDEYLALVSNREALLEFLRSSR